MQLFLQARRTRRRATPPSTCATRSTPSAPPRCRTPPARSAASRSSTPVAGEHDVPRRRPGRGAERHLPAARQLRARRAHQQAHPPARAQRLGEVLAGRVRSSAASSATRRPPDGALYTFNWVFPTEKLVKGSIGFGEKLARAERRSTTFAHLEAEDIDVRIGTPLREHPLFLLPRAERKKLARARRLAAARTRDFIASPLPAGRRAVGEEPPHLRRAAGQLRRRLPQGAAPRAGRALLRLAPLPGGHLHRRAADERRRRLPAGHRRSHPGQPAARAAQRDALRAARPAGLGQPRPHRVRRSAQAPAGGLQVPARLLRDRRRCRSSTSSCSSTRC